MSFCWTPTSYPKAKRRPHPRVQAWLERTPAGETFLSALTLGELVQGVERAPEARRRVLEGWVQRVKRGFAGRILPLDGEVMEIWGRLTGISLREGHPLSPLDAMLVATALRHGLTPVTRNTAHFRGLPLSLENPWDERG